MNFMQRRLVARQPVLKEQRFEAQPTVARVRSWLLMLVLIGLIIEGAILCIKVYF